MTRINLCICVLRYGGYNYIFSFSDKQLSQHCLLDSPSFSSGPQGPICNIWHYCVCVEFFLGFLFCSLGLFAYSCASTHFTNYYNFTVKVWISGRASHYLVTFIQNCLGYSWLLALIPIHSLGLLKLYHLPYNNVLSFLPSWTLLLLSWFYLYICYGLHSTTYYKGDILTYLPMCYHFWYS